MAAKEISVSSREKPARPRLGRILVWGGIVLLLVFVFIALIRRQQGPIALGKRAPDFTLTTFAGEQIRTSDLRGKVVLIAPNGMKFVRESAPAEGIDPKTIIKGKSSTQPRQVKDER